MYGVLRTSAVQAQEVPTVPAPGRIRHPCHQPHPWTDGPEVWRLRARQRQLSQVVTPRAERSLVTACRRAEDIERHRGIHDKATINAWVKVAAAYRKADRYDEMLRLYEEKIEVARRMLGADHPEVALLPGTAAEDAWDLGYVQPAARFHTVYYAAAKSHADSEGALLGAYGAASLRHGMGAFHLAAFDPYEAEPVLREGLHILDSDGIGTRTAERAKAGLRPQLEYGLGVALCQRGDAPSASKQFYRAYEDALLGTGPERYIHLYFTCAVFAGKRWRDYLGRT